MPSLPTPNHDEQQHSAQLMAVIAQRLKEAPQGLSFMAYMQLALYHPGLGYYRNTSEKFGQKGDFITAPELSPAFAQCLANQWLEVAERLPQASLLECGPGSGRLAAELLATLEKLNKLPEHYYLLELSADLKQRQHALIAETCPAALERVSWLSQWPEPGFHGLIVANELLDAMPVQSVYLDQSGNYERFVVQAGEALAWKNQAITDPDLAKFCEQLRDQLPEDCLDLGYQTEYHPLVAPWIKSASDCLAKGMILLIDYGYPAAEYYHPARQTGTLMCHYRHHAHDDPLIWPGIQDITSQVNFSQVATAAHHAGLEVAGYTNQAYYLFGCGLLELAEQAPTDKARLQLNQAIKQLTLPGGMGERFKAMALTKALEGPLQGFQLADQRFRL